MTKGSQGNLEKQLHEQLDQFEKDLIDSKVKDFNGALSMIADAFEAKASEEEVRLSFEGVVHAYYHMMDGPGSDSERTKAVLRKGLQTQMGHQILMAKQNQKTKVTSIQTARKQGDH